MSEQTNFFIGRKYDLETKSVTNEAVTYDPSDLTTHMFVTGMTGSGKTGLCITLMEEAALKNIPAVIIDPKGDLTNLLLHFPDLLPADFKPWLDAEAARRQDKTLDQMAQETADLWKNGLAGWGLGEKNLRALKESAQFTIYTPGSTAGIPVNILSSFAAPDLDWGTHQEALREKIASNITALLGLIDYADIDPLSSREHILLSNIMEHYWSRGESFDLTDLILKTQAPPFDRLGAFPVDRFFPEKDRFTLAMRLNNFLASPSFQTWITGENLNIQNMLFTEAGKPRHSIFYLAHLSENERMFFVTLLYGAVESWMRGQSGTKGLRALVYFDEIMGYLPPINRPPSHTIMLRMLKQARAFGVGLVLTSQNPVDLDYKALSNAGTWMIGRLQTDQDKERLMDGLQNASGSINRKETDHLLSNLGKRVFLLHNVHEKGLTLFHTRWAMNYLAGPMTRNQIPALNQLASASQLEQNSQSASSTTAAAASPVSRPRQSPSVNPMENKQPIVPQEIDQFFLPNNQTLEAAAEAFNINLPAGTDLLGILYRPSLLAQAEIQYTARKYRVSAVRKKCLLVEDGDGRMIQWGKHENQPIENSELGKTPLPNASFETIPTWLLDSKILKGFQSDLEDWLYREATLQIPVNESLKLYGDPNLSEAEFQKQSILAAEQAHHDELDKLNDTYERKLTSLENKLKKEMRDVDTAETRFEQRRLEEVGTHGELLLSMFNKRKRSISSSLTKRRMTAEAKSRLQEEKLDVEVAQKELDAMGVELQEKIKDLKAEWAQKAADISYVTVTPYKKDIYLETFGIAWMPYYQVEINGRTTNLPAFN